MENKTIDFGVLYQDRPKYLESMQEFYHKESKARGFNRVWTQEGYNLVAKIALGREWWEFHNKMVEKADSKVEYESSVTVFTEDYATVGQADIIAKTEEGKYLGSIRLATTHISSRKEDHENEIMEWRNTLNDEMELVKESMYIYQRYLEHTEYR